VRCDVSFNVLGTVLAGLYDVRLRIAFTEKKNAETPCTNQGKDKPIPVTFSFFSLSESISLQVRFRQP